MELIYSISNDNFLLLAFIASIFLVSWIKEKKNISIKKFKPLNSNLFFYQDPKKKTHFISKSLKVLLGIKARSSDINSLISYFDQKDQKELRELCSHSIHDPLFPNYVAQIKVQNKNLYLSCSKVLLSNKNNNPKQSFFLFFSDITKKAIAEKQLKKENELLKHELISKNNILNSLPVPIWSRNSDLSITYFNNRYNTIISNYNSDRPDKELSRKERQLAIKAKETKDLQKAEIHIIDDGTRKLYKLYEIPVPGTNEMVGMGYDISAKEKIRSELQMHISAQSDLLESTASANAIYDSKMRLKFFNQAFIKLWGLEESWLMKHPTYSEVLEKLREKRQLPEQIDFQQFKNDNLKLFTDLISPHNEFLYLPDGRYLRVIVIPHALGGLLFSYEDITDKLTLEREYKTLSAVQKETIDSLNEGISVFSENGKLQISNEKFAQIWQLDRTYLKSKPHIKTLIEKIKKQVLSITGGATSISKLFINNLNSRQTSQLRLKTNSDITLDILFAPLPDGGTLVSYHDISDSILVEKTLLEKNEALQDADRLKTEFLANVSYELRSPLTSIIGFSQALDKQYFGKLNELQSEYVSGITESSQVLLTLINDILDLSSIDAGYMQLYIKEFSLSELVSSLKDLVRERAKEQKLKLVFSCDDSISISGDEKRIKQALFKLLNNAIDNSQQNQTIKLTATKSGEEGVSIKIEDNSTEISAQDQKYIFEIFHKIDTQQIKSKTVTLGLVLVKNFIELHGGELKFKRKKPKGAIFECILPVKTKPLEQKQNLELGDVDKIDANTMQT